jgi:D-alanyl-D-alanine dipeptidase/carboxypeptidase
MKKVNIDANQTIRGNLILINRSHPIHEWDANLVPCPNGAHDQVMNHTAAFWLTALFKSLDGSKEIQTISGWRSQKEQQQIYEEARKEHGEEYAKSFVALPDCSEHQTGLAVDLAKRAEQIDWICPSFPREGICEEFRRRAHQYGFIERYPVGKERITGISPEEWHFRYVGVPHAGIIRKTGFTLEEYLEFLKLYSLEQPYRFSQKEAIGHGGKWEVELFYLSVSEGKQTILMPDDAIYEISGDNCGGAVVSVWRDFDGA